MIPSLEGILQPNKPNLPLNLLYKLYHLAGIAEYWVINSLDKNPELVIYRHTEKAYVPVRSQSGWVKSSVLGASFCLVIDVANDDVRLERK